MWWVALRADNTYMATLGSPTPKSVTRGELKMRSIAAGNRRSRPVSSMPRGIVRYRQVK